MSCPQHLGRAPTPSELAAHLGISKDDVYEGLEASNAYRSSSLDDLLVGTDTSVSLGDVLGEEDPELVGVENREALQPLLEQLPAQRIVANISSHKPRSCGVLGGLRLRCASATHPQPCRA